MLFLNELSIVHKYRISLEGGSFGWTDGCYLWNFTVNYAY